MLPLLKFCRIEMGTAASSVGKVHCVCTRRKICRWVLEYMERGVGAMLSHQEEEMVEIKPGLGLFINSSSL
jgi:hypothetical protein